MWGFIAIGVFLVAPISGPFLHTKIGDVLRYPIFAKDAFGWLDYYSNLCTSGDLVEDAG